MTALIIFIFGLAIGSFLNVVIYRLEQDKSFVFGRSYCPKCKKTLAWHDNIPLLSFIVLAGRCRFCKKGISWQYPLVELATAVVYLAAYWRYGLTLGGLAIMIFCSFLLLIFVYDFKHYLIPDGITIPAMAVALILNIARGFALSDLLLAAIVGAGFFGLQYVISRGQWIGGGDIRLGALMGLMLGFGQLLAALFIAYLIGSVVGVSAVLLSRKRLKSQIPFGPFLVLGTLIVFIWGRELIDWYLSYIL